LFDREKQGTNERIISETVFLVNGLPIKTVPEFKYLGRMLSNDDSDWPAVKRAVQRAQVTWGRLGRILSSDKASPKAMASIYRAVVQAVLLYGSESWVLTNAMLQTLQSFHHRCARFITGQHIRQNEDKSWTCPPSAYVLNLAGLLPIQEYIEKRRKSVEPYVFSRPIYQQCVQSRPLARNANRAVWWQRLPDGVDVNL
jgi:hypothetical protein